MLQLLQPAQMHCIIVVWVVVVARTGRVVRVGSMVPVMRSIMIVMVVRPYPHATCPDSDRPGCPARRTETSLTTIGATTTAESLGSILPGTPLDRPVRDRPQPCQSGLWIGGGVRDPDVANWHLNPYYHCTYGDGEVGRFSSHPNLRRSS